MKIVKIVRYDPVKGKGTYLDNDSCHEQSFTYHSFEGPMIQAGKMAELTKEFKLRVPTEGRIKRWLRRMLRWQ